jgi:hypothetical protein
MNFFKYLFLLLIFISFDLHAYCEHPSYSYGTTRLNPMPSTACYPELNGSGFCKFKVEQASPYMDSPDSNLAPYAAFTLSSISDQVYKNSDCTNPPLQEGCVQLSNGNIECEEEEEEEEENDPVLQCSSDSCPNPDNKRCPVGYSRGSFNGQNLCVKNNSDEDEECNDPNGCDESNDEIIAAIDRANNDITNSTNSLGQTLTDALNSVKNALGDIADKLQNLADSMINGNNGPGQNTNQPPDTSQFNADLPVEEIETNHTIDTGLYSSNSQCPAKKIINIPQYGLHYEFDFSEICNMLQMFGYLVMVFAYVAAARIVTKS